MLGKPLGLLGDVLGRKRLDGQRDLAMQQPSAGREQSPVDDLADPVVGEVEALARAVEDPPPDELLRAAGGVVFGASAGPLQQSEVEVSADDGGHLHQFPADVVPYLAYFLAPVIAALPDLRHLRRPVLAAAFVALVAISFTIHFRGANRHSAAAARATPRLARPDPDLTLGPDDPGLSHEGRDDKLPRVEVSAGKILKRISEFGFFAILTGGATLIQVDEYALGIVMWFLAGAILILRTIFWGEAQKGELAGAVKTLIVFVTIGGFVGMVVWTNTKKSEKPWSNFMSSAPRIERNASAHLRPPPAKVGTAFKLIENVALILVYRDDTGKEGITGSQNFGYAKDDSDTRLELLLTEVPRTLFAVRKVVVNDSFRAISYREARWLDPQMRIADITKDERALILIGSKVISGGRLGAEPGPYIGLAEVFMSGWTRKAP